MSGAVKWYSHGEHKHADLTDRVGVRVVPSTEIKGIGHWQTWTVWIGPAGARVLHQAGACRSLSGAKRAAVREGRKIAGTQNNA